MSNHLDLHIRGKLDWSSTNWVVVVGHRRTNPTTLKTAIEYARAIALHGKTCRIEELPSKDAPDTQTNLFDSTLLKKE